MQKILSMSFWFLLVFCLSSCSGGREGELEYQLEQLTIENTKLQKNYDGLVAAVKSDQDLRQANERAAGVAAGCDWLLSLCPKSLVEAGRSAIQAGNTPNLFYFWTSVFIKVVFAGVFIAVVVITTTMLYLKVVRPTKEEVDAARSYIDSAVENAKWESSTLSNEISAQEDVVENLIQTVEEKRELLLKINAILDALNKRQAFLVGDVARLEALRDVLKVLD